MLRIASGEKTYQRAIILSFSILLVLFLERVRWRALFDCALVRAFVSV